jgi:hypothetical protein
LADANTPYVFAYKTVSATTAVSAALGTTTNSVYWSTALATYENSSVAYTLTAATGYLSLTGAPNADDVAIGAQGGSYALTGYTATLHAARKLAAAQGSYSLVGYPAQLSYFPAPPPGEETGGLTVWGR